MVWALTEQEREAAGIFLRKVRDTFPDEEVAATLFGSRVRGEGQPDSDLDVLVVVGRDDLPIRRHIFDVAYEVFLQADVLISPLVLSRDGLATLRQNGRRLAREIERDGVSV
jgi:predicted nucleotidyltransferase